MWFWGFTIGKNWIKKRNFWRKFSQKFITDYWLYKFRDQICSMPLDTLVSFQVYKARGSLLQALCLSEKFHPGEIWNKICFEYIYIDKEKRIPRNVLNRFFSQTEAASSSIPGCDLLVELFVDTSASLLFDCAHNTKEINRVISFLFR